MSQPLLHLTCADLHAGCPARLEGASTEELVLAYVVHRCEGRDAGTVVLEDLLTCVTASVVPQPADRPARAQVRALVGSA